MKTEFDQLIETLIFGTGDEAEGCDEVNKYDRDFLFEEYSKFCELADDLGIDPDEVCLTGGDVYEQMAHDYVMTRMGHGVGFWETSDWEEEAGQKLTEICKSQGTIVTYVEDDKVYIY